MKLIVPPGYSAVVPFNKRNYSRLAVQEDKRFAFAGNLNAIFTTVTEFIQCVRYYPIVFSSFTEHEEYVPMAVTGLTTGKIVILMNKEIGRKAHIFRLMINMYHISEKKFKKLTAKALGELRNKNYLYFIYAHLMSLDNVQLLLDREKLN